MSDNNTPTVHQLCDELSREWLALFEQKRRSARKLDAIADRLDTLYDRGRECVQRYRLGIFKRARLALCLQQKLREGGVPQAVTSKLVIAFVTNALVAPRRG